MKLKGRTLLVFSLTFGLVVTAFIGLAGLFSSGSARRNAEASALRAYYRAAAVVEDDLDALATIAEDWAVWTDMYDFVRGGAEGFEEANLDRSVLATLRLRALLVFGPGNAFVAGLAANAPAAAVSDAPSAAVPGGELYRRALASGGAVGIAEKDGAYYLCACWAIVRSDGAGEPAGAVVMARAVDADRVSRWARLTGTVVELADGPPPPSPAIRRGPRGAALAEGLLPYYAPSEGGRVPALRVGGSEFSTRDTRDLLQVFHAWMIAIAVGMGAACLFWLDRIVLRPLGDLASRLDRIAAGGLPAERLPERGGDELERVSRSLNRALDVIEEAFRAEEERARIAEAGIAERDSLLREIRHRVKNNLQVVASILNLQADEVADPALTAALRKARRRVLAMGFVQEALYTDASLSRVDARKFLERLVVSLQESLDPEGSVSLSFSLEAYELDIEKAVPFALIVNEAISNAFSHAFRGRPESANVLEVRLAREGETGAVLRIADNGVGIPPEAASGHTLGFSLMGVLAGQIDAETTCSALPSGGTAFELRLECGSHAEACD